MSQSLYPVNRQQQPSPPFRSTESHMTKVLAVLLLVVAGALVFTVIKTRGQQAQQSIGFEPRTISQRPVDKLGADEKAAIEVFKQFSRSVVHITSLDTRRDRMTLDVSEIPQGTGSGFLWDSLG